MRLLPSIFKFGFLLLEFQSMKFQFTFCNCFLLELTLFGVHDLLSALNCFMPIISGSTGDLSSLLGLISTDSSTLSFCYLKALDLYFIVSFFSFPSRLFNLNLLVCYEALFRYYKVLLSTIVLTSSLPIPQLFM